MQALFLLKTGTHAGTVSGTSSKVIALRKGYELMVREFCQHHHAIRMFEDKRTRSQR